MPKPTRFDINDKCTKGCSLSERNLGNAFAFVHGWFQEGASDEEISHRVDGLAYGIHLSYGAVGRHRRNHLVPQHGDPLIVDRPKRVDDLELLDLVISRGAELLASTGTKVSPDLALRAMELKYKFTQGNVMEGFFGAIGAVMEEEFGNETNPDAITSVEEQEQGDAGATAPD